jgi:hypothetical protein
MPDDLRPRGVARCDRYFGASSIGSKIGLAKLPYFSSYRGSAWPTFLGPGARSHPPLQRAASPHRRGPGPAGVPGRAPAGRSATPPKTSAQSVPRAATQPDASPHR